MCIRAAQPAAGAERVKDSENRAVMLKPAVRLSTGSSGRQTAKGRKRSEMIETKIPWML